MIIVIVWEEDNIDFWKVRKSDAWIREALGSEKWKWTCAFTPNRICDDIESCNLYEDSSMANKRNLKRLCRVTIFWNSWCDISVLPSHPFSGNQPLNKTSEFSIFSFKMVGFTFRPADIIKMLTVKVISCYSRKSFSGDKVIYEENNSCKAKTREKNWKKQSEKHIGWKYR